MQQTLDELLESVKKKNAAKQDPRLTKIIKFTSELVDEIGNDKAGRLPLLLDVVKKYKSEPTEPRKRLINTLLSEIKPLAKQAEYNILNKIQSYLYRLEKKDYNLYTQKVEYLRNNPSIYKVIVPGPL